MKGYGLIAAAATLILAIAAPFASAQQLQSRWTIDQAAADRGKQDFAASCSFCHGSDARGSERAPDLLRSELVNRDDAGELIGQVVTKGRTDKGMPSFPALSDQVKDIAQFLHGRIQVVFDRMRYHILNVVTGDAKAGQAYFDGPGQCRNCHSPTGDLAGAGGKYKPEELQAIMLFPGPNLISYFGYDLRHVWRPQVHVTAKLRSGQTLSGVAVSVGEYDIALHDEAGAYRSFSREDATSVDIRDPLDAHRQLLERITDRDMHDVLAYLAGLK